MGRRATKEYNFKGLAGCVGQAKSRVTGTLVGLYHADQAGLEDDPSTPWATVCEEHHSIVCHPTLATAKEHASDPTGWCDACREAHPEA